jgi:hypothetical protein
VSALTCIDILAPTRKQLAFIKTAVRKMHPIELRTLVVDLFVNGDPLARDALLDRLRDISAIRFREPQRIQRAAGRQRGSARDA